MDNRDNLIEEIEILQRHLEEYRAALLGGEQDRLHSLLKEGRLLKEKSDSFN